MRSAILSMTGAKLVEIKVRHHPRRFGRSKYGLSRIFKVLSDLIAIKTLVTFTARPLLWFGILALTGFAAGFAALGASIMLGIAQPGTALVIPFGLSIIFLSLGMFLLLCGLLSELVYRTGSLKIESLARITRKVI